MKHCTLFLLMFFGISYNTLSQVQPTDTDGDGYLNISTLDHLRWVSENSSSWVNNFELDNDINASATESWNSGYCWSPIGVYPYRFTGKFEGNGFAIDSLYINRPGDTDVGFIGRTSWAVISNLGIKNCRVIGNNAVGGLVGLNNSTSQVINCYSNGSVSGNSWVGGLVGFNHGKVIDCNFTGSVSGKSSFVGGLIGLNDYGSSVSNSYNAGSVSGKSSFVGGLIGYNLDDCLVSNSHNTGRVIGEKFVGGLVGSNNSSTVSNSYNTGNVSGVEFVGGLVGSNSYSNISNSYSTDSVIGLWHNVGGLVGENHHSTVSNCYSTGNVYSYGTYIGGLVGKNYHSTVSNSYSIGNVKGGASDVGAFIGSNDYYSTVINSFWNSQTCVIATSAGGIGLTTKEMKIKSTFTDADWDFDSTWAISGNYNDGYPNLDGINGPVGVLEIDDNILVYPQPSRDELYIKLNLTLDEPINAKLFSQAGEVTLELDASAIDGLIKLNTSSLSSGVYHLLFYVNGITYSVNLVLVK